MQMGYVLDMGCVARPRFTTIGAPAVVRSAFSECWVGRTRSFTLGASHAK